MCFLSLPAPVKSFVVLHTGQIARLALKLTLAFLPLPLHCTSILLSCQVEIEAIYLRSKAEAIRPFSMEATGIEPVSAESAELSLRV